MRFDFLDLPGDVLLSRPVIPVQFEDLEEAPQLCLVDTGSTANRFGAWLAEAVGIDLSGLPRAPLVVGGLQTTAYSGRADLTIAGLRYDAPVTFCEPWPFAFHLLGQEGFLRFFSVLIRAAESWLEVEPEEAPVTPQQR